MVILGKVRRRFIRDGELTTECGFPELVGLFWLYRRVRWPVSGLVIQEVRSTIPAGRLGQLMQ